MDKIAMIKVAEIAGVANALVDAGILKVASSDDFDVIVESAADTLDTDYDVSEAVEKVAEIAEIYEDTLQKLAQEMLEEGILPEDATVEMFKEALDKEAVKKYVASIAKKIRKWRGKPSLRDRAEDAYDYIKKYGPAAGVGLAAGGVGGYYAGRRSK